MVAAVLIDACGSGMFLATSALYFTQVIGLSVADIGLGLAVAGAIGVLAPPVCGQLADVAGPRRVVLALFVWRAVWYCGYLFVRGPATFVLITCLVAFADRGALSTNQVLASEVAGDDPTTRARFLALRRSCANAGFGVGGLLGGLAFAIGTSWSHDSILIVNALSYAAAALLISRLRGTAGLAAPRPTGETTAATARVRPPWGDPRYVSATIAQTVLTLDNSLLLLGIPLWFTAHGHKPDYLVPILFTTNTVLVIVLQVPLSRFTDSTRKAAWSSLGAAFALAGGCVLATDSAAPGAPGLAVAFGTVFLLTVSEVVVASAGWELSYGLAPSSSRGRYIGFFGLSTATEQAVGPLVLTSLVIPFGWRGWLALAGVLLSAGAVQARAGAYDRQVVPAEAATLA